MKTINHFHPFMIRINHGGNNQQNHVKIAHLYFWYRDLTEEDVAKFAECGNSRAERTEGLIKLCFREKSRIKIILYPFSNPEICSLIGIKLTPLWKPKQCPSDMKDWRQFVKQIRMFQF